MAVPVDPLAAAVPRPVHQRAFRNACVGAGGTKQLTERVQPTVDEARFVALAGKLQCQRGEDIADQTVAYLVRFDFAPERTMGHRRISIAVHRFQRDAEFRMTWERAAVTGLGRTAIATG